MLIYELLTGASPFTVEGEKNSQQEISKRILRNQPPIPDRLSPEVQDLLNRVLVKEPEDRLTVKEIKKHPFFRNLNWSQLAQRRVTPPFTPKITSETDVSNFAEEFTSLVPNVSVLLADNKTTTTANNNNNTASGVANADDASSQITTLEQHLAPTEDLFIGYSYVAPSLVSVEEYVWIQLISDLKYVR